MEEYIELINRTDSIFTNSETIIDSTQKQSFLKKNISVFYDFKNSLNLILRKYQFQEKDNGYQNEIANIVKNNIVRLLKLKDLFEIDTEYEYFESDLIESLSYNENRYVFNLQYENDASKIKSALQYLQDRNEYIRATRESKLFEEPNINGATAKKYISNEFAKFLAKIDVPNDYEEFLESEHSKQFEWLTDFNIFNSLKECEKLILDARKPFLPSEYYIKN